LTGGTGPERGAPTLPLNQMTIKLPSILKLADTAANAWSECDIALVQVNEAFGTPFEAARDNLLADVTQADNEGFDLSLFSGAESKFKFPQYKTNIVVRISRKPTPHDKLQKLADKVADLEQQLRVARLKLKQQAELLVQTGECDQVTDKISLAFTRLK
jgi:hypothetical protein